MLIESTMSNNMSKAILAVLILLISLPIIRFIEKDRRRIKARFDRLLEAGYTKSVVPLVYEIGEQVRILKKQDPINYKGYIEKLLELEEMTRHLQAFRLKRMAAKGASWTRTEVCLSNTR
ncbi:MAG: hypothetical protein JRI56_12710 [Deltaproteobacteria bacterium]|nr:hypothetical protein [Deltaproteobacteria bacterium]